MEHSRGSLAGAVTLERAVLMDQDWAVTRRLRGKLAVEGSQEYDRRFFVALVLVDDIETPARRYPSCLRLRCRPILAALLRIATLLRVLTHVVPSLDVCL